MGKEPEGLLRAWIGCLLVASVLMLVPGTARPQSVALEAGWAGVENYDPVNAAFGLSLRAPLGERWSASLSYIQWTGQDGNYGGNNLGSGWTYYGNRGLTATMLYRPVKAGRFSWALGGGLGLYDAFREEAGEHDHSVRPALTASTLLRYGVSANAGVYLRGDLSLRRVTRPNWGGLRLGLEWSPWQ